MKFNPYLHTKTQIEWLATHKCRHGHTYLEHYQCYIDEYQERQPKIGYLDIETTGFEANYHHILTYVIKTGDKNEFCEGVIKKSDLDDFSFDKRLMEDFIRDLRKYNVIYTYYGTKFDIPFVRSRALYHKLDFPIFGVVQHKDVYYMVKRLLKLHSSRLESATKFLGIPGKDHVEGDIWMRARLGDPKALAYVLRHNRKDTTTLEKLHKRLQPFDKGIIKKI
jgi:uncharacterized protein YprB with RNaseH-like and TPR domain